MITAILIGIATWSRLLRRVPLVPNPFVGAFTIWQADPNITPADNVELDPYVADLDKFIAMAEEVLSFTEDIVSYSIHQSGE